MKPDDNHCLICWAIIPEGRMVCPACEGKILRPTGPEPEKERRQNKMDDNAFALQIVLAGALAAGTAIWGWFGWLALLWAVSMALDYITGTLAAVKAGEWSSEAAREGLWHKGGMILVVLVAAATDLAVSLLLRSGMFDFPFDHSVVLTVIVMAWYTLTELGSALENATRITDRVPKWLSRVLKIAADAAEKAGEQLAGEDEHEQDHR